MQEIEPMQGMQGMEIHSGDGGPHRETQEMYMVMGTVPLVQKVTHTGN